MAGGNPWKISTLISACYEFVLALFLLFRMLLGLVVLELAKYLPVSQTCTYSRHRNHNLLCPGPPFSPCRERNTARLEGITGAAHAPARFSRGLLPGRALSEDISTNRKVGDHASMSKKAGSLDQARSVSLSSVYKRKKRTPSLERHVLFTQDCKGSVDGERCKCIASEIDLYDDLIEVSSEYLKQKDRGHEEVILSLLKALQAERRNLRTLYEELEEERIAAETAANEAMGMILRLQEEKSALQMEAAHYQRVAEEKALHDEQAIQLLEEDLCQKESERLLLEEELNLLRARCYGDVLDVAKNVDNTSCTSEVSKPLLLLAGIDEASWEEDTENAINPQDCANNKCNLGVPEETSEAGEREDQPPKKLKSFTVLEKEMGPTVDSFLNDSSNHLEKRHLFNDEDDAKSILLQLSALEKQLLALEESEKLDSLYHVQAQAEQQHLACGLSKSDGSHVLIAHSEGQNDDISKRGDDARTQEEDFSNLLDEEKVVTVDVTNVNDGPYCGAQVPAAEEILELHERQHSRRKIVQWEAYEEEKHLDMPSFVPTSNSKSNMASTFEETCKPDLQCLQGPCHVTCKEENWNGKRVTLEDINLRLQALENESTLLRHRSAPPNPEQMSMLLLREVMQELQELLKANRNGSASATNETLSSMDAYVKGGHHKKRHFSDGPGLFS